jgi:hypothetical protein
MLNDDLKKGDFFMKISYEQAVERKEQLEKEYRILQQLKKKGEVDPNGPYYCFTLTDMGYDIIDDYSIFG